MPSLENWLGWLTVPIRQLLPVVLTDTMYYATSRAWFHTRAPLSSLHLSITRAFAAVGLAVIALGTGGIKPCVSAFGGDQFHKEGQVRNTCYYTPSVTAMYMHMYFSVCLLLVLCYCMYEVNLR